MRFLRYLRKSPTAKNASASYFATLSMGVSAFVSIPIAVHFLKKEEIGLWAVVSAVVNYLTWMDLGIGDGIGRKIAASVAAKDRAEINRWWTVSIFALSLLGMLLVVVGGALTPWMISVFEVPSQLTSQAYILFLGSIVLVGIGLPYRGAPGLLTAQQRFHWVSLAQGIAPWISILFFYLTLRSGWGMVSYVAGMAATVVFTGILYGFLIYRGPEKPGWDRRGVTVGRLKELLGLSLNISVMGIVEAVFSTLPAIILARYGGLAAVPIYTITSRVPMFLAGLVRRTLWAFYPRLLRLHVTDQREALLRKHRYVGLLTAAVALIAAGGVLGFNRMIVELLAGPGFYAGAATDAVLACIVLLDPVSRVFLCLLYLSGTMGRVALVSVMAIVAAVIFSVFSYRHLGLPGLAGAMAILPLAMGTYGYFQGRRGGNFKRGEVSLASAAIAAGGCGALVLLSVVFPGIWESGGNAFQIFGKAISIPGAATVATVCILVSAGGFLGFNSLRRLRG